MPKLVVELISFPCIILLILINLTAIVPLIGQHSNKTCFLCKEGIQHPQHESPYHDFSFKSELPFVASLAGLTATNFLLTSPSPLTEADILQLDGQTINSFDRYAISKNSKKAQRWSDFFLTGVLVLPKLFH